jgi:hypothetical protein
MKRMFMTVMVLGMLALGTSTTIQAAVGSAFGALATADPIGQGRGDFGFGVGIADATSFTGSFTYGLSQYVNGRFKLGLVDTDISDTRVVFGGDFAWQFLGVDMDRNRPFDLAAGGLIEYASFEGSSVLQIGGHLTGSYPFKLSNGSVLIPYGRFNVRMESLSWDTPVAGADDSDSNLEVGLNGGLKWTLTSSVALFGEFQIDGNDGVFFGLSLGVL